MRRRIQTAVAVAVDAQVRCRIPKLLAAADVTLVRLCGDAEEAMRAIAETRCDLIVADALLPNIGGAELLRQMLALPLPVQPDAILTADPMLCGHTDIEGVCCLAHPISVSEMCAEIERLRASPPRIDSVRLTRAKRIFADLGFPDHVGTRCLECASVLCAQDERWLHGPQRALDAVLAEICGCLAGQVERAMRHAIEVAWRSDKLENQNRIFGDTIDEKRGWPTCREMIARIADILRLEGCI